MAMWRRSQRQAALGSTRQADGGVGLWWWSKGPLPLILNCTMCAMYKMHWQGSMSFNSLCTHSQPPWPAVLVLAHWAPTVGIKTTREPVVTRTLLVKTCEQRHGFSISPGARCVCVCGALKCMCVYVPEHRRCGDCPINQAMANVLVSYQITL